MRNRALQFFNAHGSSLKNEGLLCNQSVTRLTQYDFAHNTRRLLGLPLTMLCPCSSGASVGIQRIVTFKSCFIFASVSGVPSQCARANPPWISGCPAFLGVKKA